MVLLGLLLPFSAVLGQSAQGLPDAKPKQLPLVSLAASAADGTEAAPAGNPAPGTGGTIMPDAQWDFQFGYAVSDSVGYFSNAGAYWTGTEFWVSKWNSDTLATLDSSGSVTQIFTIPGVTGIRSITSDGTFIYLGTAGSAIRRINPANKTLVNSITVTGAASTIGTRFLTYDPTLNSGGGGFYIGNFSSAIGVISMTGATLTTIPLATHGRAGMYGAAYDGVSAGGPYLWVFHQAGTPSNAIISQLQLPAGTFTGVSFDVANDFGLTTALAGGLFIGSGLVPGENTIGGVLQGTPNVLFGYELDFSPIAVDAQLNIARPLPGYSSSPLFQGPSVTFQGTVFNAGFQTLSSASLNVSVRDLGSNTVVFTGSSSPIAISPAGSQPLAILPWSPGAIGEYEVTTWVSLGGQTDLVPGNDSVFYQLAITDSVLARYTGVQTGNFGVGAGPGQSAAIGQDFTLSTSAQLNSVTVDFGTPPAGVQVSAAIYPFNPGNTAPTLVPLAFTDSYTFTANDSANGVKLTLPIQGGAASLPAGRYLVAVSEVATNVGIRAFSEFFTSGTLWFKANNVGIGNWTGAVNTVVLAIEMNLDPVSTPVFSILTPSPTIMQEAADSLDIQVNVTGFISAPVSVDVSLSTGSATIGQDFFWDDTTLVFTAPGTKLLRLSIINDTAPEPTEDILFTMSNPVGGTIGQSDSLLVQIIDDDTNPLVFFTTTSLQIDENEPSKAYSVIGLSNPGSDSIAVRIRLDQAASWALQGTDFTWTDTLLILPPDTLVTQGIVFGGIDDLFTGPPQFFVLVIDSVSPGAQIGINNELTVSLVDDDVLGYPIEVVTEDANGDGLPDSLGVRCMLYGVVQGINFASQGYEFVLHDFSSGIQVFSPGPFVGVPNVQEGYVVDVRGVISHVNGLARIEVDTMIVQIDGVPPVPAQEVIALGEDTEHEPVLLACYYLVNPATWPAAGQDANVLFTNGLDTVTVRIDKETNIDGSPVPQGIVSLMGFGSQVDSTSPYTSGYQLLPRYVQDIAAAPLPVGLFDFADFDVDESTGGLTLDVELLNGLPDSAVFFVRVDNSSTATSGQDFSLAAPQLDLVGCRESGAGSFSLSILNDNLIEGTETIVLVVERTYQGAITLTDTATITITETDPIADQLDPASIRMYPNPGRNLLVLESELRLESIHLSDLAGRRLLSLEAGSERAELNAEALPAGMYLVRVETAQGSLVLRWVKQE